MPNLYPDIYETRLTYNLAWWVRKKEVHIPGLVDYIIIEPECLGLSSRSLSDDRDSTLRQYCCWL
jgi:hypothetical protein